MCLTRPNFSTRHLRIFVVLFLQASSKCILHLSHAFHSFISPFHHFPFHMLTQFRNPYFLLRCFFFSFYYNAHTLNEYNAYWCLPYAYVETVQWDAAFRGCVRCECECSELSARLMFRCSSRAGLPTSLHNLHTDGLLTNHDSRAALIHIHVHICSH